MKVTVESVISTIKLLRNLITEKNGFSEITSRNTEFILNYIDANLDDVVEVIFNDNQMDGSEDDEFEEEL
jgi:hypothetical protein